MQVYNETIRDLLMPGQPLAVREDPQRGVCVSGLTLHKVLPPFLEGLCHVVSFIRCTEIQNIWDVSSISPVC